MPTPSNLRVLPKSPNSINLKKKLQSSESELRDLFQMKEDLLALFLRVEDRIVRVQHEQIAELLKRAGVL